MRIVWVKIYISFGKYSFFSCYFKAFRHFSFPQTPFFKRNAKLNLFLTYYINIPIYYIKGVKGKEGNFQCGKRHSKSSHVKLPNVKREKGKLPP